MPQPTIHTHSYQHFESLQLSTKEFYESLEKVIKSYQFPKVTCSIALVSSGSIILVKREYLLITYADYTYYVCAAPFGQSYFISWWMEENGDQLIALLRKTPILKWFVPSGKTFYEIDTELMFTKSIDAIIQSAINKLKAEHGYREPVALAN